jgi:hypothetical protein
MDPLSTVTGTAITEGVKFLYQQADEFLSAWRARRHDKDAPPPRALDGPEGMPVIRPLPLADPPDEKTVELLEQLRGLVEPIRSGKVDALSPASRAAVEQLRDVIEALLCAPVRLAGEPPRPLDVCDIRLVTQRVTGRVTGLRADLAKLPGGSRIHGVNVHVEDVAGGGEVIGVDLT